MTTPIVSNFPKVGKQDVDPIQPDEIIDILRNTTGRVDASDPLFTDAIMLRYLNRFITQLSTQDIRIFKNYTWWEFDYGPSNANPLPVDLQALGLSTIGPVCYVSFPTAAQLTANPNLTSGSFPMAWYVDPGEFYARWPDIPTAYTPQRPTYVLYYNNQLTFRGPPDQDYHMKFQVYNEEYIITNTDSLFRNYMFRYVAYGAALDIFSDYGEMDKWRDIFPAFNRYRALVTSRTWSEYQTVRTQPEF